MKRQTKVAGMVAVLAALTLQGVSLGAEKAFPAPVPKTGANVSYMDGDDGTYQAGVAWPTPRLTVDEAAGTVMDNLTGLMWAKNAAIAGKDLPWAEALAFCKQLDLGGHKDWRLPNIKEYHSLNDWSLSGKTDTQRGLPPGGSFTGVGIYYWTSTTYAFDTNLAWFMTVWSGGYTGHEPKTRALGVWPVRGGVLAPPKAADPQTPEKK